MTTSRAIASPKRFPAEVIRQICLEAGADEVGLVEIDRPELAQERPGILQHYPLTQTVIALSRALNRESMMSPVRPVANGEMRRVEEDLFKISGDILRQLNVQGIRGIALNPAFPMDMNRWPGKTWGVSHKTLAVAAGLGVMGRNRLVLSPRLGSNILLNSILIDTPLDHYDQRLEQNPCLNCGLCAVVCPTGAVQQDGGFDSLACAAHSYRDLSGVFDWAEALIASPDLAAYRARFPDPDTMGLWQSLLFGFNHKCGYCQAVCPAGEVVAPGYLNDKKGYVQQVVKPLRERKEPVYVVAGSPAETKMKGNSPKEIRYAKAARPLR